MLDPQQELFNELRKAIEEKFDVYDGALPPKNTPYPFVYLGESQMVDNYGNKSLVLGTVHQTIHVWHSDPKRRGTVSAMLFEIKGMCRRIEYSNTYAWQVSGISQRVLEDPTTRTPLLHGVLDVEFTLLGEAK